MKSILKIQAIGLSRFNNADYVNFMRRTSALLISGENALKLGIPAEDYNAFNEEIENLNDSVNQSYKSDETAQLSEADKKRDDLLSYIFSVVRTANVSPVLSQKQAGISINNMLTPYMGIQKTAGQQETQEITGLIGDLSKEENAAKVTLLGLDETIASLAAANHEYEVLVQQRSQSQISRKLVDAKTLRVDLDALYDFLVTMAFVTSVSAPVPETAAFVTSQNKLIDEVNAAYNQRIGLLHANKKSNEPAEPTDPVVPAEA